MRLSTEPFTRVLWIVLDGMGYEHARRCLETEDLPGLSRIAREGSLTGSAPSSPVCQTPSALHALFSGAQPAESGIWGYLMPDPREPRDSVSGFSVRPRGARPIWEELLSRGHACSLMNVAFRKDAVWSEQASSLALGYDGYRLWKKSKAFKLDGHSQRIAFQGRELHIRRTRQRVEIRKGGRIRAALSPGEGSLLVLSRSCLAYAFLPDSSCLVIAPLSPPLVRGFSRPSTATARFIDFNVFRAVRLLNQGRHAAEMVPISIEMKPVEMSMAQKESLMIEAIRGASSRLVIGYFPLVDELNHAYFDELETDWPHGRGAELFRACAGLVDRLFQRVMDEADRDTLLVVSSDHGAAAFRRVVHVNELLANAGLLRRVRGGYDLRRSDVYFHPSDCGLALRGAGKEGPAVLQKLQQTLVSARKHLGVELGVVEGKPGDPFAAVLYPQDDSYLTGRPPRDGSSPLDATRSGGHHLSPLTPTPWMQAMLGLWSPRSTDLGQELGDIPVENRLLKGFLLGMMGEQQT